MTQDNTNLTWNSIEKTYELLKNQLTVLPYISTDLCERNVIMRVGPKWSPEYIVFHPLDFDEINKYAFENHYRLVEVKDYIPQFLIDKET